MSNTDYVLGTGDVEVQRLGLQHAVWRPYALAAWQRARFGPGQRILDLGCGPGYATFDLADLVGASGKVFAVDRSPSFLDVLRDRVARRASGNIETTQLDLDAEPLPFRDLDGVWARWVFAFVRQPRELVRRAAAAIRPGGRIALHEYVDYETWRFAPSLPEQEAFIRKVVESWRAQGGEPDIGLRLPLWLVEEGFEIESTRAIIEIVTPNDFMWQWPATFVQGHTQRLVELGYSTPEEAERTRNAVAAAAHVPGIRMITPAVIEIIARRV